jgi:integrase
MASIRKRGASYFVEIARIGFPRQRKSFKSNAAARAWARRIETSMDDGSWIDTRETRSVLINGIVDALILSYERFNIPVAAPKLSALTQIADHFKGVSIHDLTVEDVLLFAAARRSKVSASTLQKQMYYFRQAVKNSRIRVQEDAVQIAIDELIKKKIILSSVWRDRRLSDNEYKLIIREAKNHWVRHAIDIALESGMRQGEIHALKMSDIDFNKGVIKVLRKDPKAEGGKKLCKIPLLKGVREAVLRAQDELGSSDTLFAVKHSASISDKFARLTTNLRITNLTFHDLRHEAISRMFERGMTIEQVRSVSGHTSLDQLSRYVNLKPEDIAAKF